MSEKAVIDVAVQRGRLIRMIAINVIGVVVAVAAIVGYLSFHIGWLVWVFAGAVIAGFAGHVWLMLGLLRRPGENV